MGYMTSDKMQITSDGLGTICMEVCFKILSQNTAGGTE